MEVNPVPFGYITVRSLTQIEVFRIRLILIWIRIQIRILGSVLWKNGSGSGSCSKSDIKSRKYKLLLYFFFYKKNIFLRNMICFVIYGVNIYVSKHKFNSSEKNVWYSNDFGWFLWKFSMILADFLLSGSVSLKRIRMKRIWIWLTKLKRILTDPDPKHYQIACSNFYNLHFVILDLHTCRCCRHAPFESWYNFKTVHSQLLQVFTCKNLYFVDD